ncbi:unnamed protein product [Protopolystoma xenopodis]|uniref:Uncharacterized protein n=1 Tax=Protopolystoma xenopodis TaxID=117903 RepID=A0A3S5FGJ7_9PLAT|nr:unnamed protein product [Protopolystoma xenopodis]
MLVLIIRFQFSICPSAIFCFCSQELDAWLREFTSHPTSPQFSGFPESQMSVSASGLPGSGTQETSRPGVKHPLFPKEPSLGLGINQPLPEELGTTSDTSMHGGASNVVTRGSQEPHPTPGGPELSEFLTAKMPRRDDVVCHFWLVFNGVIIPFACLTPSLSNGGSDSGLLSGSALWTRTSVSYFYA